MRRLGIAFHIGETDHTRDYVGFFVALHTETEKTFEVMPGYHIATTNLKASELRDLLKRFLLADDSLFVHEIGGWASFRTKATPKDLTD